MGFEFLNLDEKTREYMLAEIKRDVEEGSLYMSDRLNSAGELEYPGLLRSAAEAGSEVTLAADIRDRGLLRATETKRTPKGGITEAKIPVTAAQTLAEGEFNRFYVRALCARVLDEGGSEVEVYRAKEVTSARSESQRKIGTRADARKLLEDLRSRQGMDTALGLPPGPNSGLSVKLIDA